MTVFKIGERVRITEKAPRGGTGSRDCSWAGNECLGKMPILSVA